MAQLVERSFPTPEICSSNPIISKILSTNLSTNCIIEKMKVKKKRPRMVHLKIIFLSSDNHSGQITTSALDGVPLCSL